jgi:hypothetical protein
MLLILLVLILLMLPPPQVLQQALKCLQAMANDETVTKLVGVYLYHR